MKNFGRLMIKLTKEDLKNIIQHLEDTDCDTIIVSPYDTFIFKDEESK